MSEWVIAVGIGREKDMVTDIGIFVRSCFIIMISSLGGRYQISWVCYAHSTQIRPESKIPNGNFERQDAAKPRVLQFALKDKSRVKAELTRRCALESGVWSLEPDPPRANTMLQIERVLFGVLVIHRCRIQ